MCIRDRAVDGHGAADAEEHEDAAGLGAAGELVQQNERDAVSYTHLVASARAAAGFGSFGPAFHRLTGCANGGKMLRGPSSLCQRQRQRARVDLLQAGRCGAILLDDGS